MNTDLTQYDVKPEGMINYLRYNGPHSNKKLCEFAASNMKKKIGLSMVPITPYTKEAVDNLLQVHKVIIIGHIVQRMYKVLQEIKRDLYG